MENETCRFGHICTSGCGNDFDCPCQSDHCCELTEDCEGKEHCDDHYCQTCGNTKKVIIDAGLDNESMESCPDCVDELEEMDMTGASDYQDGGNNR